MLSQDAAWIVAIATNTSGGHEIWPFSKIILWKGYSIYTETLNSRTNQLDLQQVAVEIVW